MSRIREIAEMPTTLDVCGKLYHESILRSWATLNLVREMVTRGDSREAILMVMDCIADDFSDPENGSSGGIFVCDPVVPPSLMALVEKK